VVKKKTMKPKTRKLASRHTLQASLLLLALNPVFCALGQQVIYVDAANNTGIEDGTEQHPFNTIKEGIAAASAGSIVMIKAGTYHPDSTWQYQDSVLCMKPGVSLKGEGQTNTFIEGIIADHDSSSLTCNIEDLYFREYHFARGTVEGPSDQPNVIRRCSADLIIIENGGGIPVNDTTLGPNFGFLIENNDLGNDGSIGFAQGSGVEDIIVRNNTCGTLDEVTSPGPDPDEAPCGIMTKAGWGYITGNKIYGGEYGYMSSSATEFFADNEISGSYNGFSSIGLEEVHHNTIHDCHNDGMILRGLKGPIHDNVIKDNAGAGIRVLSPWIDLGGGEDDCPGNNVITGNGDYDLNIECQNEQHPVLYARYNVWDHSDSAGIAQYDIRDANDSTGLVSVEFTPVGHLGVNDLETGEDEFIVSPNPTRGKFQIANYKSQINSKLQIPNAEVVDLYGKVMAFNNNRAIEQWSHGTIELDISHLPAGCYFVRIKIENRMIMKKIIKL
jgi:hypothetical protein